MPPHPCSGAGNAAQIFERTFGSQKYVARASDGLLSNKSLTESWVKVLGARGLLLELIWGLLAPRSIRVLGL